MSTLATLRQNVKDLYRETSTALDSFIDLRLNQAYMTAVMRPPYWRQLLVVGASFPTTAGTETYPTSSDFNRIVPNSMLYYQNTATSGFSLRDIDYEVAQPYKIVNQGIIPQLAFVVAGTSGSSKRIQLIPPFTDPSGTVTYDYYKFPSTMAATDSPAVAELETFITYKALADLAMWHKDMDGADMYSKRASEEWRSAMQVINGN